MICTYLSFCIILIFGHISDFFASIFSSRYPFKIVNGFSPIYSRFESFYIRRAYKKISDCFDRPIHGFPDVFISMYERKFIDNDDLAHTNRLYRVLNFGSYNYLGFANKDSEIINLVLDSIDDFPMNIPGVSSDIGTNTTVRALEKEIASFLYKEDSIVFPMGFCANASSIPCFIGAGDLILSDEHNHTSIIYGLRMGSATVRTFPHNDPIKLKKLLNYYVIQGQPDTRKAWKRIFVFVEGVYSMEGTILCLKEIVELKKIYKFYLFIDEAHSIGAIGATGRGICEYTGVSFDDVDILMGTFTKSFNGFGGYIASSQKFINFLRLNSDSSKYGEQMSPIVAKQILEVLKFIKYVDLGVKQENLRKKSIYMREKLESYGFVVYGNKESPIIPVLIFHPGKIGEFSRLCLERGLAVVVVGYPATDIMASRVRLCMSASQTYENIDVAIEIIKEVGELLGMNLIK